MSETVASCAACERCGLFKSQTELRQPYQPLQDSRMETLAGTFEHAVLFVHNYPSLEGFLQDPYTDWVITYLNASKFEWAWTALNMCNPGLDKAGKKVKPKAGQVRECTREFFAPVLDEFDPDIVVAVGGEVLKSLWPADRGDPPPMSKARLMPVQDGGRWLLGIYDPRLHGQWFSSGGKDGQDLTDAYVQSFMLMHDLLAGSYKNDKVEWVIVKDHQELLNLVDRLASLAVQKIYLDVEDDSWLGKARPHVEDPEGTLEEHLTVWHPGNKMLCLGVTVVIPGMEKRYETYVIVPSAWAPNVRVLEQLWRYRHVECWNTKYDVQSIFALLGLNLFAGFCSFGDGFLVRGLPNQSKTGNSLKQTASDLLNIPVWDTELDNAVTRKRKELRKAKQPTLVSMGMLPMEVWLPYNANDTFQNARLVEEKLTVVQSDPDFPWIVHDMLIDGLETFCEMERNGLPVDMEVFDATLDEMAGEESRLYEQLRSLPEVSRAEEQSGRTFNIRSPLFYAELVKDIHGVPCTEPGFEGNVMVPRGFPRTDTNRLASDKVTLAVLAGEDYKAPIAWNDKTHAQRIWTLVMRWRSAGDDYTRLCGMYGYVVDGRIHATFRILKSERGEDDSADAGAEDDGGAISGRFSQTPNTTNVAPRARKIFRTPPGWLWFCPDYGRIELAWIAWNSQDPLMMEWARKELDQHRERGKALWGLSHGPTEGFEYLELAEQDLWRSKGKTQNFATIYLEEPGTTAVKTLSSVDDVIADLVRADQLHPKIRELKMDVFERCNNSRLVKSCFGRCRGAEGWAKTNMTAEQWVSHDYENRRARNQTENMSLYRSIWNTRAAQADASDTTFYMTKEFFKRLKTGKWLDPAKIKLLNFVHDSPEMEIRADYLEEAAPEIIKHFKNLSILPVDFDLPLPVDAKFGPSRAELQKWSPK